MKTNLQIDEYFLENLLTKSSLSNCITAIPKKINLIVDNTTNNLVLKAGSKVVYFDNFKKEVTADIKLPAITFSYGNKWLAILSKDDKLSVYHVNTCFTGKGIPTLTQYANMLYLDLDTLHFHSSSDTGTTWVDNGVCAVLGEVNAVGSKYENISWVFNGFGYFDNVLFVTPETKALIPNGINSKKGDYANIETDPKQIILHALIEPEKKSLTNGTVTLFENNIEIYPSVDYDKKKNLNSVSNTIIKAAIVGKASTNELGKITDFYINDVLRIANQKDIEILYKDMTRIDETAVHKTGDETITGAKTFTALTKTLSPSPTAIENEVTTANWVNTRIQKVNVLPAEPNPNVLYVIPE